MMLMKNQDSSKKLLEAWRKADRAMLTSPDQAPQQAQSFSDKVWGPAEGLDCHVMCQLCCATVSHLKSRLLPNTLCASGIDTMAGWAFWRHEKLS
jgi:hypothetical protein